MGWWGFGCSPKQNREDDRTAGPRQLREKNVQLVVQQDIMGWVGSHGFNTSSIPLSNIHAKG